MNINGFSTISSLFNNRTRTLNILSALGVIASIGFLTYQASSLYGRVTKKPAIGDSSQVPTLTFTPDNTQRAENTLPVDQTKLLRLSNLESLPGTDFLSNEDLSLEKTTLESSLQNHLDLLSYIHKKTGKEQREALMALMTLIGIKPALIFEGKIDQELYDILSLKKDIQLKQFSWKMGKALCLASKHPLEIFNPRHFLEPLQNLDISLTDATIDCFIRQGEQETDQMLSYLLGFGPSFEAYKKNTKKSFVPEQSIFSDTHYAQLGKVLSTNNCSQVGFSIHQESAKIAANTSNRAYRIQYNPNSIEEKILMQTGTTHVYDGISARTEYSKKSLSLKKWVLETYFPEIHLHKKNP